MLVACRLAGLSALEAFYAGPSGSPAFLQRVEHGQKGRLV
jgi:hypothetical protein